MEQVERVEFFLPDPDATAKLARLYADVVRPGDTLLLEGSIGAGKTHFARSLIQAWLEERGAWDEVPSPTYTLVQTYENGDQEIWHADLYRLTAFDEVLELGLGEAFESSIVLVEWPDRLGASLPVDALRINFVVEQDGRRVTVSGPRRLTKILDQVR